MIQCETRLLEHLFTVYFSSIGSHKPCVFVCLTTAATVYSNLLSVMNDSLKRPLQVR